MSPGPRRSARELLRPSAEQRFTFLYREVSPDALQIPPLAVEVGATKPRRRKPVPAPVPVGAAPLTAVPAPVYP